MKFHLKRLLVILCLACVSLICWTVLNYEKSSNDKLIIARFNRKLSIDSNKLEAIDCLINDDYVVKCLHSHNDSVYIPFSFISKYFEIGGKVAKDSDGKTVFEWQHSYSKVIFPKERYDSWGAFLWFDNYNVEVRDRVKCVSGAQGVPLSTQWQPSGHFYPIQIAQFGLSHFSKNLTAGRPRIVDLDSGDLPNNKLIKYIISDNSLFKRINTDEDYDNKVIQLDGRDVILKLKRKLVNVLHLSFDVKPLSNFSLKAVLKTDANSILEYSIAYTSDDRDISVSSSSISYGIGSDVKWKSITRDLGVDLSKGFTRREKKLTIKTRNLYLTRLELSGNALLDNIRLLSSAHESYAKSAADWFVRNQEENGGWPIKVVRKLSNGVLTLKPNWYSAMAQGQAISLLTRMYRTTNNLNYFDCAKKALQLFEVDANDNGIKTYFVDKYVWYEEYPTTPSSFVLNGFIYALFGLYDLKTSCDDHICLRANQLYKDGLNSLEKMLPLFDSGSGSMYDLRHFGLGIAPNIARWDYHTTHINQLLFLNTIEDNFIFQTTAKRWISYMKGMRAHHN